MPHLKTSGASVYYEVMGEGPPLLMIAGIASDMASWGPLLPYLQNHFQLVRIDNRGAGRTEIEGGAVSIGGMLADCLALIDHLGHDKVNILGHSMGGLIGLRLAHRRPERVNRLVAMTTGTSVDGKAKTLLSDMARLHEVGVPQKLWFRLLYQWLFAHPFFADAANIEKAAEASIAYRYIQPPEKFALQVEAVSAAAPLDATEIKTPTLAIAAGEDMLIPAHVMKSAFAGHPALTFETIEGAGHSVHWDAPGAVAKAVKDFLRD